MIKPTSITDFKRSRAELELFWLFCILVAGKNSDWAALKVNSIFRHQVRNGTSPFAYLRRKGNELHNFLVANKVGQYTRIERAINESLCLDLENDPLEKLLSVFGVGPKTARFFLLHTRQNCNVVVLDVHILRYLRERWGFKDAPLATPSEPKYSEMEAWAIQLIRSDFPGISLAKADLLIWSKMSGRLD